MKDIVGKFLGKLFIITGTILSCYLFWLIFVALIGLLGIDLESGKNDWVAFVLAFPMFISSLIIGIYGSTFFLWLIYARVFKIPRERIEQELEIFMENNPRENKAIVNSYYRWCLNKIYG